MQPKRRAEAPAVAPRAVGAAFTALWTALDAVEHPGDRAALLDRARAALDRGADGLDPRTPAPGLVAGAFWIEDVLAEGPSSTVFLVRHRDLDSLHALKTLSDRHARDPARTRLMLREAMIQLRVRHPAVVSAAVALRLPDGRPALLMDHVQGRSLAARLSERPLAVRDTLALGVRLATALAAVHATGAAHLDLSAANVLLPGDAVDRAQLCDFGLALKFGERRSADDLEHAGTPGFMAPEQADPDWPADPRADLYALGRVLARAAGDAVNQAPGFAELLGELCAHDPDRRSASAEAAGRRLVILAQAAIAS